MIRKSEDMKITQLHDFKGGTGTLTLRHLLEAEELHGAGRMFAVGTLAPGASIGKHQHEGDFETYDILSGTGTIDDNGTLREVKPGDMGHCPDGESHALMNTGGEDLRFMAVIQYTPARK